MNIFNVIPYKLKSLILNYVSYYQKTRSKEIDNKLAAFVHEKPESVKVFKLGSLFFGQYISLVGGLVSGSLITVCRCKSTVWELIKIKISV